MENHIDMGHARALLAVDSATQITLATQIIAQKLSVREAEKLVVRATMARDAKPATSAKEKSRDVIRLEEELSDALATKVSIRQGSGKKGELIIDFGDLEQLDGIIARLRQPVV